MTLFILKATEPTPTAVVAHIREERIVLPYVADRQRTVTELPEVTIEPPPPILLLVDAAEMRKAADGEWITVHPNGPDSTGQPVLVRNGTIVGGAGGKLNGTKVSGKGKMKEEERPSEALATEHKLPPRTADTMSDAIAMTSPSGRMSGRAKAAMQENLRVALFGKEGLQRTLPPQPSKAEKLERRIRDLRDWAARGMSKRAFTREADMLQAELDALRKLS